MFLVALQPVDCKLATPVDREFLEISSRGTFGTYQCTREKLKNADTSPVALLINDSTNDALPVILKILTNICDGDSLQYSCRWQTGQLELLYY